MDESTLTHHYHPAFIVHGRTHLDYYTFYGFGQIYIDMSSPLVYIRQSSFAALKICHIPFSRNFVVAEQLKAPNKTFNDVGGFYKEMERKMVKK